MKKYRNTILALLLSAAVLCSFWIPRRALRTTAQVAGIALDQGDDGLIATFELYSADADETIGSKREIAVGYGDTLEACMEDALHRQGKTLFVNDASVLILGAENADGLLRAALNYYSALSHDHMDLPVFFAKGTAASLFEGEGEVLSVKIEASAKGLGRRQTVKDLMNGRGVRVLLKEREGGYEIQG